MKIFGRDPAMILMAAYALVALGTQFVVHITPDQQTYINVLLSAVMGLIVSWSVARDRLVPAFVGFAKAALALALGFGLHLTVGQQASLMTAVTVFASLMVRQNVTASVSAEGTNVPKMPFFTS